VILFDGICNLCNRLVLFVIARDPHARFMFASLQSDAARRLLSRHPDPGPESLDTRESLEALTTVLLWEDGRLYAKSTAALRISRRLRFPWPLAYALVVVPRGARDWVYDFVANRRYRWFGKRDVCMVPTHALRARFLEE
jgi:predicted DCC family thiol-disulfide oxidoreductase YuxK